MRCHAYAPFGSCPARSHDGGRRRDHCDWNGEEHGSACDGTADRHRPVQQGRLPQQCGASGDQRQLQRAAHHVQCADRFRVIDVWTEREADRARRNVYRDDNGVSRNAEPQPRPRRPPDQNRGPYHLSPRDHQEEDAVEGVFREMFEHDSEMDGRRANGERRHATQQVWPDSGLYFLAAYSSSAHTVDVRFEAMRPASADRTNLPTSCGVHTSWDVCRVRSLGDRAPSSSRVIWPRLMPFRREWSSLVCATWSRGSGTSLLTARTPTGSPNSGAR